MCGENEFVMMIRSFHADQAKLRTTGDWLRGFGWVVGITAVGVALCGVASRQVLPDSISCDQNKTSTSSDWCCVVYFVTPGLLETQRRQP